MLYLAGMKTCKRCGDPLPLASFQVDRKNKDGRKTTCRQCCSQSRTPSASTRKAEAKVKAALALEQQARTLALKELVAKHRREFERMLADHRTCLQVDHKPKWVEVL